MDSVPLVCSTVMTGLCHLSFLMPCAVVILLGIWSPECTAE